MIADLFMTASPVPRILRALRLVISKKSGSFDGHIKAIYESATRLTRRRARTVSRHRRERHRKAFRGLRKLIGIQLFKALRDGSSSYSGFGINHIFGVLTIR